jgi:importin subunit beta-1
MLTLTPELMNDNNPLHIRNAAAINIKNALVARVRILIGTHALLSLTPTTQDTNRQQELNERWLALPEETRARVKHDSLLTLASPHPKAGTHAAQVISSIAAIEIPVDLWPDLITQLLGFASDQTNTGLRMNALTTIGQICEVVVSAARLETVST